MIGGEERQKDFVGKFHWQTRRRKPLTFLSQGLQGSIQGNPRAIRGNPGQSGVNLWPIRGQPKQIQINKFPKNIAGSIWSVHIWKKSRIRSQKKTRCSFLLFVCFFFTGTMGVHNRPSNACWSGGKVPWISSQARVPTTQQRDNRNKFNQGMPFITWQNSTKECLIQLLG